MKIEIAASAGFCFGVRRATKTLEDEIASGSRTVYTLGRLIHNDGYNRSLEERGVRSISSDGLGDVIARARSGEPTTVVVRAHGEDRRVLGELEAAREECPDFCVLDCTCPYVDKVRRIAEENSGPDSLFILIGAAEHPEVRGIMSCCRGDGLVFPDADSLERWICSDESLKYRRCRVSIAAQTTQKMSEWKKCLKIIEKVYTNPFIFDTICNVTAERQKEAYDLARRSDVMIVIGSRGSSNTVKLYEICSSVCDRTYLIEDASGLSDIVIPYNKTVSITAGASTPYSVIREVERNMSETTENFAQMLEESLKTLNTGDVVCGTVSAISPNEIHLDLGAKTTGVISRDQITDDQSAKLEDMFKLGDEVEAFVIEVSDVDGIATLSKKRVDSDKNWKNIVAAYESGEILEGKIVEAVKGGVIISLDSNRVFIPASQTGIPRDGDLSALVGTTQRVKIIEVKNERRRAYASIRAVAREERKAKEKAFWDTVEEGAIYEGPVKSLTSYGAFVDLGGVDGMVHLTELSWRRIHHPSEVVKVGDVIKVFVKSIDREKGRISLGYKTEDTDPWFIFNNKYKIGDTANVKVVSLMPFGAFAEIVPGVDGLIHISQIADHKIEKPDDVLKVGDTVDVKITDINQETKKVSLSIRALLEQGAKEAEEASDDAQAEEASEPKVFSTDNPEAYADFGENNEE